MFKGRLKFGRSLGGRRRTQLGESLTEGRPSKSNLFPLLRRPPLGSLWSHAQGVPSGLLQAWFLKGLAS